MPRQIIVPQFDETHSVTWTDLRRGIKNCIVGATAGVARVYSHWPMKYNVGQTIKLLQSKNDLDEQGNKKIHSWMVSVASADPEAEGTEDKIGGLNFEWELRLRVWGFIGYALGVDDDGGSTHDTLENEARLVSTTLWVNRQHLSLDVTPQVFNVGKLKFEDIDVHGFGNGVDCHVAQGFMNIQISEEFDPNSIP